MEPQTPAKAAIAAAATTPEQPAQAAAATTLKQPAPTAAAGTDPNSSSGGVGMDLKDVMVPPPAAPTGARAAVSGLASEGKRRKYTRRPVCPDDRCRRCWYIECGVPGGPKHTLDGMCLVTALVA